MHGNRLLKTASILIVIGMAGLFGMAWVGGSSVFSGNMMAMMTGGGMMDQGRMKDMMQEMMSGRLPPGIKAENLPDPKSTGAKLAVRYCTRCHDLPSPSMHTAEDWPKIADRMFGRIKMMGGMRGMMKRHRMNIQIPGQEEEKKLLVYLQDNALIPLDPKDFDLKSSKEALLFQNICSQCHGLPDPKLHTPEEWPSVVDRMLKNSEVMEKKVFGNDERNDIVKFLSQKAK